MEKDTNIIFRVNSQLKENVANIAKKYNVSLSELITACLEEFNARDFVPLNIRKHFPTKYSKQNEVTIANVQGGTKVQLEIYGNDGCEQISRIIIDEPYFNKYYGSTKCKPYIDKLVICSSQFTSTEVTESILDKAIYNYNHDISQKTDKDKDDQTELTFFAKIREFLLEWGVKIILFIVTTGLSVGFYNTKFRKMKHGI